MSNQEAYPNRAATRAPVERPIRLQFDDSMDSVEGICENLSIGGMFIRVRETRPQGSLVRFELPMDDSRSIRGLAEVVWMRTTKAGPGRDAGVGIKFRFLEQRDRQLIFKVVSEHIKERLANRPSLLEEEPPAPQVDESMIFRPPDADQGPPSPPPPPPPPPSPPSYDPPAAPSASAPPTLEELSGSVQPMQPESPPAPAFGYDSAAEWEPPEPEPLLDEDPSQQRRPSLVAVAALVLLTLAAVIVFLWPGLIGGGGEDSSPSAAEELGEASEPPPTASEPSPQPEGEPAPTGVATQPQSAPPPAIEPEPQAAPPPPPPPPPAVVEKAFDRLEDISANRVGSTTEIVLTTNGSVPKGRYRSSSIGGDKPRALVKLLGVSRSFRTTKVPVDAPLVDGVRLGYHKKSSGNELHVVIDLEGPGVKVEEVRAEGRRLVIRLTAK